MLKFNDNTLLIFTVMLVFMISYLNYDPDKQNKIVKYDCQNSSIPQVVMEECNRLYGKYK